jgi:hypothetical protein
MTEGSSDIEFRDFPVACDWCGTVLVGQIRREQVGQMVVVAIPHVDGNGRPCRGSGRGVPVWPVRVWPVRLELRAVEAGYEIRVDDGQVIACPSREALVTKLRDFGVERDEAQRQVAGVEAGKPVVIDVPERRRQPRRRGEGVP